MKIKVNDIRADLRLIGKRAFHNQVRHYYRHIDHEYLIICVQEGSLEDELGKIRAALWSFEVDGRIVCHLFPNAPAWWATTTPGELTQVTVRKFPRLRPGRPSLLSDEIKRIFG